LKKRIKIIDKNEKITEFCRELIQTVQHLCRSSQRTFRVELDSDPAVKNDKNIEWTTKQFKLLNLSLNQK
jgi:hypothetical protein